MFQNTPAIDPTAARFCHGTYRKLRMLTKGQKHMPAVIVGTSLHATNGTHNNVRGQVAWSQDP